MLSKQTAAERFEERLQLISRTYAFVGPIGVMVVCASLQLAFTDYFKGKPGWFIAILIAIVFVMVVGRLLFRQVSRRRLALEYATINLIAIVAINYLLPFPSPYIIALSVLAILLYFDFGTAWFAVVVAVQNGAILVHGLVSHFTLGQMLDLLIFALAPSAFSIFVIGLMGLARQEIGAIERNSARALDNEQRVESLINNITDGVIAVDHHLQIIVYNAAALDVLDINTDIKGKKLPQLLQPIDAQQQAVDVTELLEATKVPTINRDLRVKYADGSVANLFIGISPIYLGYGKAENNGYTLILRDITREKSLEEERDEFISVVSHELRTPIAIAEGNIGNAQFVAEKTGDMAAIKKALSEAHNQTLFLAEMINDLSTLSRAERGTLQVEVEPINVHDLVTDLADSYKPQAATNGLNLKTELDPQLELLYSSKLYVREILQNFIVNAIKYTPKGSVTLQAVAEAKGVRFAIQDTGIGISKSDQERVFDKFFRSEDFRTRKANGTGLGLYVTMKLTRLIHAEIELKSELNKGSTFTVFIPNLQ